MISHKFKITRSSFPEFTERKNVWTGDVFRVNLYLSKNPSNSQFAVVLSKKQYTSAAERNLFKRRFFSVIQNNSMLFKNNKYGRFVFFPRQKIQTYTFAQINNDIVQWIARLQNEDHINSAH
jgi:ribonuclease P protein component